MDRVLAMIMAGGRGQRMGELCRHKPKPALPFAGSYRVIDFSLSNCLNSQIQDIAILTGYQRSYLGSYLKRWQAANSHQLNLAVLEPESGMYLGTADSIYQNLNQIEKAKAETVLILAADHVYQMDYREIVAFHKANRADVTVGVLQVPLERASQFGIVETDAENRIIKFVEKPARPQSNLVSMGIYVFNVAVLRERLIEDAANPDSVHDFGHVILPGMLKRNRILAYKFQGYWQDIGTPESYHKANLDLIYPYPAISLDGLWPVYPCEKDYLPRKIKLNNHIQNSFIGAGCTIKGYVKNSIISPGVWVAEGAVIEDSVVMSNVWVGRDTRVVRSIIDEGAVIDEGCIIGSRKDIYNPEDGVTVLGQNCQARAGFDWETTSSGPRTKVMALAEYHQIPEPVMG